MPRPGGHDRAVVLSEHVYRALLTAYPRQFRQDFGEEMAQAFGELCREEQLRGGTSGLLLVWIRTVMDLLTSTIRERGDSFVAASKLVRVGGLAAVSGGLLTVCYGVVVTVVGMERLARPGPSVGFGPALPDVLMLLEGFGSLLFLGGLVALVRLIERRAPLALPGAEHPAPGRSGRLSWAQRSASAGVILTVAAGLASVVLLVRLLVAEPTFVVGPASGASEGLFAVLGGVKVLGLPLATTLLGVAAWRSGVLGRWGALPIFLGLAMSPLSVSVVLLVFHLLIDLDRPFGFDLAADLLLFGVPNAVTGLGWALFGWLLFSGRDENGRESAPVR